MGARALKNIIVTSSEVLRQILAGYEEGYLFRGQTRHFEEDGQISVATSFDRQGCIPSQMLKWSRYASNVLDVFVKVPGKSLNYSQAILQHYGWRSFFVDCSASPAVSAWFASHGYSERNSIELCEDCEEEPVMLIKREATYSFEEGDGHLYVLDKARSSELVGLVDLQALNVEGHRARTTAQKAWLLGTLRNQPVPADCFVAHISGPRSVFRDYAAEEGLVETNDLFPTTNEDPVLRALLGLPWKQVPDPNNEPIIPFFRRTLELPEYHESFVKIAPRSTAFFRSVKVADFGPVDGVKFEHIVVSVPDIVLFGSAEYRPMRFPKVMELLAQYQGVVFEIDELIQHANMGGHTLYQKGISLMAHEPNLIEVGELMVEHPGLEMTAAGMLKGWFYAISGDGTWQRVQHPDQCSCGSERTHKLHLSALQITEHFLANPEEFDWADR